MLNCWNFDDKTYYGTQVGDEYVCLYDPLVVFIIKRW
jgi:hypothetical protein